MSVFSQFDRTAFAWINTDWSNPIFNVIMPWITHIGDPATIWLWIIFIGSLMGWQLAHSIETDQGGKQHRTIMKAVVLFCLYMALIYDLNFARHKG